MAWYYEILGKDDEVLETSEPVYASQFSFSGSTTLWPQLLPSSPRFADENLRF